MPAWSVSRMCPRPDSMASIPRTTIVKSVSTENTEDSAAHWAALTATKVVSLETMSTTMDSCSGMATTAIYMIFVDYRSDSKGIHWNWIYFWQHCMFANYCPTMRNRFFGKQVASAESDHAFLIRPDNEMSWTNSVRPVWAVISAYRAMPMEAIATERIREMMVSSEMDHRRFLEWLARSPIFGCENHRDAEWCPDYRSHWLLCPGRSCCIRNHWAEESSSGGRTGKRIGSVNNYSISNLIYTIVLPADVPGVLPNFSNIHRGKILDLAPIERKTVHPVLLIRSPAIACTPTCTSLRMTISSIFPGKGLQSEHEAMIYHFNLYTHVYISIANE